MLLSDRVSRGAGGGTRELAEGLLSVQNGKVDVRLPGDREFKLPWRKAVLVQSSR